VPVLLSFLTGIPSGDLSLSRAVAAEDAPRDCLREWLARVPDPRSRPGRWHRLEFVLALAVCAYTAAGHEAAIAVAEWGAQGDRLRHHQPAARPGRPPPAGLLRPPALGHRKPRALRDVTFREDAQKTRTGNQPSARAVIRNLVIGAIRGKGFANIAHARRYYARDDQRILALYGYA
jgi:hypothetical protein